MVLVKANFERMCARDLCKMHYGIYLLGGMQYDLASLGLLIFELCVMMVKWTDQVCAPDFHIVGRTIFAWLIQPLN